MSARGKSIAYFGDLKGDFFVSRFAMVMPDGAGAGTSIELPDYAKGAREIKHAIKIDSIQMPSGAHQELTIVEEAPDADEIQLYDKDNIRCGDAILADEVLLLVLGYNVKLQSV